MLLPVLHALPELTVQERRDALLQTVLRGRMRTSQSEQTDYIRYPIRSTRRAASNHPWPLGGASTDRLTTWSCATSWLKTKQEERKLFESIVMHLKWSAATQRKSNRNESLGERPQIF